jgi:tetratricopeptide (TPR) repeat protein
MTPNLRKRFLREARAVARLTHPHIVPVYEVGEVGPILYIASALVEGKSLAQWLRERGAPCNPRTAAALVADLADAMDYAHGQGILHRDLKPANVLLELPQGDAPETLPGNVAPAKWVAKVADFGLAKILDLADGETRTGALLGTPAYMSPEQARADHSAIGPATDIYALGAILYELLTGRPPFRADSDAETLRMIAAEEPVAPRRKCVDIQRDLDAICLKCLEKSPTRRYASAGQLSADLRRFLAGEPTQARPLPSMQRLARWTGRNRRVAALLATVASLLICVAAVSTVAAVRIAGLVKIERDAREEISQALLAEQKSLEAAQAAERQAVAERANAETQAATAAQVSNFLVNLFMTADPMGSGKLGFQQGDEVGRNLTLRDLLDRGSRQAKESLREQPAVRASVLGTLGRVYTNLGLLEQSEPLVREAYELRRRHPENEAELANSLKDMAALLRWRGDYILAERLLREAMEIRERLGGKDTLEFAEAEVALGLLLVEKIRVEKRQLPDRNAFVEGLFRHGLAIQRRELGDSHRDVGVTMTLLMVHLTQSGKNAEAQEVLKSAMAIFVQQPGAASLAAAVIAFQQAQSARFAGKIDFAEKQYRLSLGLMRKVLGNRHMYTLLLAADLGGMLRDAGRMEEYERICRETLDATLAAYPHGHPMLIEALNEWLPFIIVQGRFDEAQGLLEMRIDMEERFLGPSPERAARGKLDVADLRIQQGRFDDASRLLDEAVALIKQIAFSSQPPFQRTLQFYRGNVAMGREQWAEAERLFRGVLAEPSVAVFPRYGIPLSIDTGLAVSIHKQRPSDEEAEKRLSSWRDEWVLRRRFLEVEILLRPLSLAQLSMDKARWDDAEGVLRFAWSHTHAHSMPGSYLTGLTDSLLGACLSAKGKPDEAEPLLVAGLENLRISRGVEHPLTREAHDRLVVFYRSVGRTDAAASQAANSENEHVSEAGTTAAEAAGKVNVPGPLP